MLIKLFLCLLFVAIERIFPGCGIYIKSGILHHLSLHIPWTSLTSSPICIRLENLELEAVAITVGIFHFFIFYVY